MGNPLTQREHAKLHTGSNLSSGLLGAVEL